MSQRRNASSLAGPMPVIDLTVDDRPSSLPERPVPRPRKRRAPDSECIDLTGDEPIRVGELPVPVRQIVDNVRASLHSVRIPSPEILPQECIQPAAVPVRAPLPEPRPIARLPRSAGPRPPAAEPHGDGPREHQVARVASLEPVRPAEWRKSTIPTYALIRKTIARRLYRLETPELDGLQIPRKLNPRFIGGRIPAYMQPSEFLLEREVEKAAWSKRGGPDKWDKYLDRLRRKHLNSGSPSPFPEPFDRVQAPHIARLQYAASRRLTPVAQAIKRNFVAHFGAAWIWQRAYAAVYNLHATDSLEWAANKDTRNRYETLKKACMRDIGLPLYPPRPLALLPASLEANALRQALNRIPEVPVTSQPARISRRFTFVEIDVAGIPVPDSWVDWSQDTFDDVFECLTAILLGLGEEAWALARWEVYDKYSECRGINVIQRRVLGTVRGEDASWEEKWVDNARFWLRGQCTTEQLRFYHRDSEAGRLYNSLLPNQAANI